MTSYCCRFCKFSTAGKTAPGVKMKLEPVKSGAGSAGSAGTDDGCAGGSGGVGRREVCGYGRNIFMGYLNRDNETKVSCQANDNIFSWISHNSSARQHIDILADAVTEEICDKNILKISSLVRN